MKKKLIIGAVTLALLSGPGGVYAGTLIKQGSTKSHLSKEQIIKMHCSFL